MANLEFCDKHNMVAFLEKSEGSEGFHEIIDFLSATHIHYALTENPKLYVSFIKQFWTTTAASTRANREVELTATIDGHIKTITEASLRRHLKLEDKGGVTSLPNSEIFEQLALMGYVTDSDKLTFQKGNFSPQWRFFIHTILHCLSPKKTAWEQFSSNIASAIICLATNRTFNFSKMIFDAMVKNVDSPYKFLMYPRFIQICLNMQKRHLQPYTRNYPAHSLTNKVFSNMKRVSRGYNGLEVPLFPTMLTTTETSPLRITSSPSLSPEPSLSPQHTPSTSQPPNTQPTPDAEEAAPTPHESPLHNVHSLGRDEGFFQIWRRSLTLIDIPKYLLVQDDGMTWVQEDAEGSGRSKEMILRMCTAGEKAKDKGKAIMIEDESVQKKSKKQLEQESLKEIDIAGKKEAVTKDDEAHDIDWSDPSVIRYHALQNRPRSVAEVRKNMIMYLKNHGGYKMKDFKGMSYNDIRPIFEKVWDQVYSFVPMNSEEEVQRLKRDVEAEPVKRQRTKESRQSHRGLTKDKEIELWVELKLLFEPDAENLLELHKYMHDPLKWCLYDMCAVHHVSTEKGQDIFMLVEKDYPLTKGLATLMLRNKIRVDQHSEMADELLIKIYNIANKPRK
ncbi:hypothetical protein Tco_0531704 [Tanacetum coccineum]